MSAEIGSCKRTTDCTAQFNQGQVDSGVNNKNGFCTENQSEYVRLNVYQKHRLTLGFRGQLMKNGVQWTAT